MSAHPRLLLDPPAPGVAVEVLPGVVRLTASNPSLMTGPGTNSYLVGQSRLVVVDPGPDDEHHVRLLAEAGAARGRIAAIVATHTHEDHSPAASRLAALTGAPVLGFGARDGFFPDAELKDGDVAEHGDVPLLAVHTPGHASNHLCYLAETGGERVLLSGDHVMGGSTVVIAPPDGSMQAYLDSLERLLSLDLSVIAPGHGPLLDDPQAVIKGYIAHRLARETAVLEALRRRGEATVDEIVGDVYTDVPAALHPIARYSVWAHLLRLGDAGEATCRAPGRVDSPWRAAADRG